MSDSNLVKLYGVETKRINEAVRNNPQKFPGRFSWSLSDDERDFLRSHFATLKLKTGQYLKKIDNLKNPINRKKCLKKLESLVLN